LLALLLIAGIGLGAAIVAVLALSATSDDSNTAAYIVDRGVEEDFAACIIDEIKEQIGGFSDFDDGVGRGQGTAAVDGFVLTFFSECSEHTDLSRDQMLDKFANGF
jgi:hypothetical protein